MRSSDWSSDVCSSDLKPYMSAYSAMMKACTTPAPAHSRHVFGARKRYKTQDTATMAISATPHAPECRVLSVMSAFVQHCLAGTVRSSVSLAQAACRHDALEMPRATSMYARPGTQRHHVRL